MGMMIHRAMARLKNDAPKEPVKKEEQAKSVTEEARPVEEPHRGRPPKR